MPAANEQQRRSVKAGLDYDTARRQRSESKIELRKAKKDDALQKRRNLTTLPDEPANEPQASAKSCDVQNLAQQLHAFFQSGAPEGHQETVIETVRQLRKLLSAERHAPIDDCINVGLVPLFIQLLSHSWDTMAFEAAWCVTNIASGSEKQCAKIVDGGAVRPLIALLKRNSLEVKEQAIWALGNIAGDCVKNRDLVIAECGIFPLLEIIAFCGKNQNLQPLRNATWVLSNLMRGKPKPSHELIAPAMPTLLSLLSIDDTELLTDTCWALSYLSDGDNESIDLVAHSGAVPLLMQRLQSSGEEVATPALRTLCNILTGHDNATQTALDHGLLNVLPSVMQATKSRIRKEACWALSNVAAGTPAQVDALMSAPKLVEMLIDRMVNDEFDVKKEAAWTVANVLHAYKADASTANAAHVQAFVNAGAMAPLVSMLDVSDTQLQILLLDAIHTMLNANEKMGTYKGCSNPYLIPFDEAGGIDKLEALQEHNNKGVYEKAVEILEAFFGEDNDEDENLAPNAGAHSFVFGLQQSGHRVNAPFAADPPTPQFAF
jgi:hypothetical protein